MSPHNASYLFIILTMSSINKKTNGHGHTLLHLAVINGKQDFVTILVMLGAGMLNWHISIPQLML